MKQNQPRIMLCADTRTEALKSPEQGQNARHAGRSNAGFLGVYSTLLREKLVAPILL